MPTSPASTFPATTWVKPSRPAQANTPLCVAVTSPALTYAEPATPCAPMPVKPCALPVTVTSAVEFSPAQICTPLSSRETASPFTVTCASLCSSAYTFTASPGADTLPVSALTVAWLDVQISTPYPLQFSCSVCTVTLPDLKVTSESSPLASMDAAVPSDWIAPDTVTLASWPFSAAIRTPPGFSSEDVMLSNCSVLSSLSAMTDSVQGSLTARPAAGTSAQSMAIATSTLKARRALPFIFQSLILLTSLPVRWARKHEVSCCKHHVNILRERNAEKQGVLSERLIWMSKRLCARAFRAFIIQ